MERFEIIIRAEGPTSIWIALLALALLCVALVAAVALFRLIPRRRNRSGKPSLPTVQQAAD
jgi:hypothetical protein